MSLILDSRMKRDTNDRTSLNFLIKNLDRIFSAALITQLPQTTITIDGNDLELM